MSDINYESTSAGFSDTVKRMQGAAALADELNRKFDQLDAAQRVNTEGVTGNAGAREAGATAAQRLIGVLNESRAVLTAETEALAANTAAWRGNATARGAAGAESVAAGGRRASAAPVVVGEGAAGAYGIGAANRELVTSIEATAARIDQIAATLGRGVALPPGRAPLQLGAGQADRTFYGGPGGVAERLPYIGASQPLRSPRTFVGGPEGVAQQATRPGYNTTLIGQYTEAEQSLIEKSKAVQGAMAGVGEEQSRVNSLFQASVGAYASSSQALTRHGALTTEFIQAFARGEVTLKEFSSQITSTIGKFGGWAIAGGLVYGMVGALRDVFKGAGETQTGVAQLSRFIDLTGASAAQAQRNFRNMSRDLNVSVTDSVNATLQMARVFHNVEDASAAARAVLLATKLDQIDPNSAVQYFTGISQTYGLTAQQLGGQKSGPPGVLDALNAIQNVYGARVAQTLPGVAKAGPAALAAGTDINTVESLVAIGVRAGLSGAQVATGLVRSASNFVNKPANQAELRGLGLNPNQPYGDLFNQAAQLVGSGRLQGKQITQLAAALGGPQLGGRTFAPILEAISRQGLVGGQDYLQRVRQTAAHPPVTAEEDLQKILGGIGEQFRSIGVRLQDFGSALASSGALLPIQALLTIFQHMTGVLGILLTPLELFGSVINALPGPIQTLLGVLLAANIGSRALNRFGPTAQGVAGRFPGLGFLNTPENVALMEARRTTSTALDYERNQRERLGGQVIGAGSQARRLRGQADAFQAANDVSGLDPLDERRQQVESQWVAMDERAKAAVTRQVALMEQFNEQTQLVADLEQRQAALMSKRTTTAQKMSVLAEDNVVLAQAGLPNTYPLRTAGGTVGGAEGSRRFVVDSAGVAYPPGYSGGGGEPGPPGGGLAGAVGGRVESAGRFLQSGARSVESSFSGLGRGVGVITGTVDRLGGVIATGGAALTGMAGRVGGLGSRLKGFLSSLGPLDYAFIGLAAFAAASQEEQAVTQAAQTAQNTLGKQAASLQDAISNAKQAQHGGPGFLGQVFGDVPYVVEHPIKSLESVLLPDALQSRDDSPSGKLRRAQAEARKQQAQYQRDLEQQHQAERTPGAVVPYLATPQIQAQITAEQQAIQDGSEGTSGIIKAQTRLYAEVGKMFDKSHADVGQLRATIAALNPNNAGGLTAALQALTPKDFSTAVQGYSRDLQLYGRKGPLHSDPLSNLIVAYNVAAQKQQAQPNDTDANRLAEAQQAATQGIIKYAQDNLKAAESVGRGGDGLRQGINALEKLKAAASSNHDAQAVQQIQAAENDLRNTAYQNATQLAQSYTQLAEAQAGGDKLQQAYIALRAAEADQVRAQRTLTPGSPEQKQAINQAQVNQLQARQNAAQEQLARVRAAGSVSAAQVPSSDTVGQAQASLQEAQREYDFIIAHRKDFDLTDVNSALATVLKARQAVGDAMAQNAQELNQLQTQLAEARDVNDPTAVAGDALAGAKRALAEARTPAERGQALIDIQNAQNQADQAFLQSIKDRAALQASRTNDPLAADRINIGADRRVLAASKGEARITAQTDLNNQIKQAQQDRVSQAEQDVQFGLDMGKLSKQAAITQLEGLLKLRNLSRQTRQQIQLQIHQLQTSDLGSFDLAPAGGVQIKLPTAYDVHRAVRNASRVAAGHSVAGITQAIDASNHVTVIVEKAGDEQKVFEVLDKALRTNVRSRMRSAGLRGS